LVIDNYRVIEKSTLKDKDKYRTSFENTKINYGKIKVCLACQIIFGKPKS